MKKYEIKEEIGDGAFGIVYEGRNKETNQKVAIKRLKRKYSTIEQILSKSEVKVLRELNNDNIVKLKEVIKEKTGVVSYIFEYCDCNLYDFIENHRENKKKIPEQIICEIIYQIVKGMKYMHSKKFFHRDLKPENILVILNNYSLDNMIPNQVKIKIADFGTAKEIPTNNRNSIPLTDYVCTRWYRAPECVFRGDIYDEKVDIWAIGCIMAELYRLSAIFQGENEFDQINQILKILGTPTRSKWPWGYYQADLLGVQLPVYYKKDLKNILGDISKEGINLINELFTFDSTKRPSCSEILNHPYFNIIPKPKNIITKNLKNLARKNNHIMNTFIKINNNNNHKDCSSRNNNKYMTINSNNNKNFMSIVEKKINNNNKNKTTTTKKNNNTYISKRNITKKLNDNLFNIKEYKANTNLNNDKINKDKMLQTMSATDKKQKNMKYVKLNETKLGLVTKKLLQFKKNKEEKKNDDKELILHRIRRNEDEIDYFSSNKHKNSYFTKNINLEDKDGKDDLRYKSLETTSIKRNALSTTKKIFSHLENIKNVNEIKKSDNYKKVNIVYNNSYNNSSIHWINYKNKSKNNSINNHKNLINASSKNNKLQKSNTITINKPKNNGRNVIKNINTKVIYSEKNTERKSENITNKYHDNHKLYISKGKNSPKNHHKIDFNNHKRQIYSDKYHTYNDSNSYNNICICILGRTDSANKNATHSGTNHLTLGANQNIKSYNSYYRNINTPKKNFLNKI
jgi:serine/threonine protein kinase